MKPVAHALPLSMEGLDMSATFSEATLIRKLQLLSADSNRRQRRCVLITHPCLSRLFSFHSRTTTLWVKGEARDE
jgi:hypothetical protein